MLPDTAAIQKEVAGDVAQARARYQAAMNTVVNTPAEPELRGLQAKLDDWAKRGTDAAAKIGATPSPNGWPGWVTAGTVLMAGFDDIAKIGGHSTLDAIVATAKDAPAEAVKTVKKAVKHVSDTAHSAEHAIVAVGAGVTGFAKEILLYGVGALVLLMLLRRAL